MKKFTFALMALLALSFSLKAQQYVSTEPANRNVILEEFTGRNCTGIALTVTVSPTKSWRKILAAFGPSMSMLEVMPTPLSQLEHH